MSLKEKLQEDLKSSMKNKDTVRKSVVTLIRASIKQYEVDNRVELDDEGIIDIKSKQLKQRRDALEEFAKANRDDLVSEREAEIKVLKEFLPQQLSEEVLNEKVKLTISDVGATSMKNKDTVKKSVVTLIRASIKQYEVDNRVELDDEGIIDIISKQLKQRRDALDEFAKANRDDLVSETEAEIKVLKEYLPQQLSEEELNEIVKLTISEVGATSMKDMGKIMSVIRPKVKGRADGKLINELVKANLQ